MSDVPLVNCFDEIIEQVIELGKFEVDTWYYSPYPEPFASSHKLFLCEFCLKYFLKRKTLVRHLAKCEPLHPPGDEIYRYERLYDCRNCAGA